MISFGQEALNFMDLHESKNLIIDLRDNYGQICI